MNWGNSNYLILLTIIPVLILLIFVSGKMKKKCFGIFADKEFFKNFLNEYPFFLAGLKNFMVLAAIVFLIIAAARPQWDHVVETVEKKGIDIVFLLDVSKSMEAVDIRPNRLSRAKVHLAMFLDHLQGDRIALVPFAGDAFVFCPLTEDYGIFRSYLDLISTDIVPVLGTDIGRGLQVAKKALSNSNAQKVVILISDGEDLGEKGIETAYDLADEDIIVYTIGIGTPEGSPIMIENSDGVREYAKDDRGNVIISKLDVNTLSRIARITDGRFYPVTPDQSEIIDILQNISYLEKMNYESRERIRLKEQYRIFLIPALIILLIESLIVLKRKKRLYDV